MALAVAFGASSPMTARAEPHCEGVLATVLSGLRDLVSRPRASMGPSRSELALQLTDQSRKHQDLALLAPDSIQPVRSLGWSTNSHTVLVSTPEGPRALKLFFWGSPDKIEDSLIIQNALAAHGHAPRAHGILTQAQTEQFFAAHRGLRRMLSQRAGDRAPTFGVLMEVREGWNPARDPLDFSGKNLNPKHSVPRALKIMRRLDEIEATLNDLHIIPEDGQVLVTPDDIVLIDFDYYQWWSEKDGIVRGYSTEKFLHDHPHLRGKATSEGDPSIRTMTKWKPVRLDNVRYSLCRKQFGKVRNRLKACVLPLELK